MKNRDKKTFTKPEQQMSKSTKEKQTRERDQDDDDYVKEELAEYTSHNKIPLLNSF